MKETIYRNKNVVIVNFSRAYFNSHQDIADSEEFKNFLTTYLHDLQQSDYELYKEIRNYGKDGFIVEQLVRLSKMLLVFDYDTIAKEFVLDRLLLIKIVEDVYNYWRKLQRFSVISAKRNKDMQSVNFIESDTRFNTLLINFYRTIQEKLRGRKNQIYRQLQAGTNAAVVLRDYPALLPEQYHRLHKVEFIHSMMMRTPLILSPKSNKRIGTFDEVFYNPIDQFEFIRDEWMIYPAKVGTQLAFLYFHRDFLASVVALGNLFELASDEECLTKKPDIILLFGNHDDLDQCVFYDDKVNDVMVGSVSYHERIEYFGYLKKMTLTLHNLRMLNKGYLPIHGAMINITFKNGLKKGIVLIGDSGAGKSESIEALQTMAQDKIAHMDIIYDDMGLMFIKDGKVFSTGTEIGAFIRLDDLEKGSAYRDMDRSIFFNPSKNNARVVLPVATYEMVIEHHIVDMVLYANNYSLEHGVKRFQNLEHAKSVFISGKRMALGTTHEVGITETYFANPFGPAQRQAQCDVIFDEVYSALFANDIYVGEIYTHLGLSDGREEINEGARQLLAVIGE